MRSSSSSSTLARVARVDTVRPPLVLQARGQVVKVYLHPDVPMRNHFISMVASECIARLPLEATHILLDLLPPHPTNTMVPTPEQRGFIAHREHRTVLCGYWALECLRVEGVADIPFWDLKDWDSVEQPPRIAPPGTETVENGTNHSRRQEPTTQPAVVKRSTRPTPIGVVKKRKAKEKESGRHGRRQKALTGRIARTVIKRRRRPVPAARESLQQAEASQVEEDVPSHEAPLELAPPSPALTPTSVQSQQQPDSSSMSQPARSRRNERSAVKIQDMWDYFIAAAHAQMGVKVPVKARMGTVHIVKQWMMTRVHAMWCEARKKYTRRKLDHMAVMLSTWKTSRDYNLSPWALRQYYDDFKGRIIADRGKYIPLKVRPPNWPFHEKDPVNPEAGAWWIDDWGSDKAKIFMELKAAGGDKDDTSHDEESDNEVAQGESPVDANEQGDELRDEEHDATGQDLHGGDHDRRVTRSQRGRLGGPTVVKEEAEAVNDGAKGATTAADDDLEGND